MDLKHVAQLSEARRDLTEQLAKYDSTGNIELAGSLRPTLIRALQSLRQLYDDEDVWQAATNTVAAADVDTKQLIQQVAKYPESLPPLLELFGYVAPPPAAQLVSNAVASLRAGPTDEDPATASDAINETRQALGQLLDKAHGLEEQRWPSQLLPDTAAETNLALDAGVTLATGALTGTVMAVIGTAILPATIASGGLAVAPVMILGGIRWWRRKRQMRIRDEKQFELKKQIASDLVPAVRGAVLQHLDVIVGVDQRTLVENPQAFLDLSDHLQALIDITRRFGVSDSHLRTAANQERMQGNDAFPYDVLKQLPTVFAAALKARDGLAACGQIGHETHAELEKLREVINNLGPRFERKPPSIKPKP